MPHDVRQEPRPHRLHEERPRPRARRRPSPAPRAVHGERLLAQHRLAAPRSPATPRRGGPGAAATRRSRRRRDRRPARRTNRGGAGCRTGRRTRRPRPAARPDGDQLGVGQQLQVLREQVGDAAGGHQAPADGGGHAAVSAVCMRSILVAAGRATLQAMPTVTILDDYQDVALRSADWSPVRERYTVEVVTEHIGDEDDAGRAPAPTARSSSPCASARRSRPRCSRGCRPAAARHDRA